MQLSVGHQGATEGDTPNVGAQVGHSLHHAGRRVRVQVGVLNHELRHTGQHGCQPHQAVEGSHKLRQVCDLNPLGNGQT